MFSEQQKKDLAANLSAANVKTRSQSGRNLSFVEGWHVIAEANRIFGFDGWTSETVSNVLVSEKSREIGQSKTPGFGVTYMARVRITVHAGDRQIIREGTGTGHGIDRDLGQAHESAAKESETDARKRALMTFGNPFGLALYDKEQTNVEPVAKTQPTLGSATQPPVSDRPVPDAVLWGKKALVTIQKFDDPKAFEAYLTPAIRGAIKRMGEHDKDLQEQLAQAVIKQQDRFGLVSANA